MFNIQKHLRHAVLAIGLAGASLTASANVLPTYRISAADTSNIGIIDFAFAKNNGAPAVTASLSNASGLLEGDVNPPVTATATGYDFGNDFAYLSVGVGGPFTFDLKFSDTFLGVGSAANGSVFSIGLYDLNGDYIGDPETGALDFSLTKAGVTYTKYSSLLSLTVLPAAAAVPEPADWLLMLTGLGFVVGMTRMNGRAKVRRLAAA